MDSNQETRYCVNCVSVFAVVYPSQKPETAPLRCKSESQKMDLVTGKRKTSLCDLQRAAGSTPGYCGEAGLWYQQKEGGS